MADFNAGRLSSDAGGLLLLREVAQRSGLLRRFAQCFRDRRAPELIEHTVEALLAQRVLAQACGYEDLNDHDVLRDDALLAVAAGKTDPTGAQRRRARDRGHGGAGKSTLNRLEGTPADATTAARYKKIVYDGAAIERLFVQMSLFITITNVGRRPITASKCGGFQGARVGINHFGWRRQGFIIPPLDLPKALQPGDSVMQGLDDPHDILPVRVLYVWDSTGRAWRVSRRALGRIKRRVQQPEEPLPRSALPSSPSDA